MKVNFPVMQGLTRELLLKNNKKIVLLVLDGLGGLPLGGKTELEAAGTPNLDRLAAESACGLHTPVAIGITPGSGPGHLALFGYDPLEYRIGRGILEALGLGMQVSPTDVAIRCNYSTLKDGIVTDRRAGRIPTEQSAKLTQRLQSEIGEIDGVRITFGAGLEHRLAVVMRFSRELKPGSADINDTDPQQSGLAPLAPIAASPEGEQVVKIAEKLIIRASEVLKHEDKANSIIVRGFSQKPTMPSFFESYGLKALCIATYPMYRGIARLVGMEAPDLTGEVSDEAEFLKKNYNDYDFFFLHIKKVDSNAEDGNFKGKVQRIEEVDAIVPDVLGLKPDVLIVTGDHSTPSVLKAHSWHPVPVLIHSPYVLGGLCTAFSERQCAGGELGVFPAVALMPLALAHSGRLKKFGA